MGRWGARIRDAVGSSGRVLTNLIGELELIIGEQPPLDDVPPTEAENRLRVAFLRFVLWNLRVTRDYRRRKQAER